MLSRYAVFAGNDYYPNGGADDYYGAAEPIAVAVAFAKSLYQDWWHIADLHDGMRIVACSLCAEVHGDLKDKRYHPQSQHGPLASRDANQKGVVTWYGW